jgi:hypothetical protein
LESGEMEMKNVFPDYSHTIVSSIEILAYHEEELINIVLQESRYCRCLVFDSEKDRSSIIYFNESGVYIGNHSHHEEANQFVISYKRNQSINNLLENEK